MGVRTAAVAAFVATGLLIADDALAGTFEVRNCGASVAKRADAWVADVRGGEPVETGNWCVSGQSETDGRIDFTASRFLRAPIVPPPSNPSASAGRVARMSLAAPPQSELRALTYSRRLHSIDEAWEIRLLAGSTLLEACILSVGETQCPDPTGGHFAASLPTGTEMVELAAFCVAAPCPYTPGPLHDFGAAIYSSVVTVEENVAPTPGAVGVTGTNAAGWLTAGATASLNGSDTLGLRRIEVVDASNGNAVVGTVTNNGCVDWSVLPCSEPSAGLGIGLSGTVPLGALTDGTHQLRARAVDAANNPALGAPVTVKIDRTSPVAAPKTASGSVAATSVSFAWDGPAGTQQAPIIGGRMKACTGPALAQSCTWKTVASGAGSSELPLGNDGDLTTVQIELTDEAGNVGLSPAVELRRDTSAPAAPSISVGEGIPPRVVLSVGTNDPDVGGYALRFCGPNGCADTRRLPFGFIEVDAPSPGLYRAEVAIVDKAGNVGPATTVEINRTTAEVDAPPANGGEPKPTTPPVARTPIKLSLVKPIRLGIKRVALRGTTQAGSTSLITVSVSGRPSGRTRSVTKRTTVRPRSTGAWRVSAALPRGVPRGRKYTIKISATPTERFTAATATYVRRR